jgi:hypothetical protein
MKVLIISKADFAGSGYEMSRALCNIGVDSKLIAFRKNKYDYDIDLLVDRNDKEGVEALNELIQQSDLIHFKGDFLPGQFHYPGLKFENKPIVITLGGSGFRRKDDDYKIYNKLIALQWHSFEDYINLTKNISVLTPDLLYPNFPATLLPHIAKSFEYRWEKPENKIIIGHSPSVRIKKGTDDLFLPVIKVLQRIGYPFELILIEKVTNKVCMDMKSKCHVFIDQGIVPAYGRSAVEAMSMGIPVITRLPKTIKRRDERFNDCPILNFEKINKSEVYRIIENLINLDLESISKKTFDWCKKMHHEDIVVKQLLSIYNKALD